MQPEESMSKSRGSLDIFYLWAFLFSTNPIRLISNFPVVGLSQEEFPFLENDYSEKLPLYGAGISSFFYSMLRDTRYCDIHFVILSIFTVESDNRNDAILLANSLRALLSESSTSAHAETPRTWDLLFGQEANKSLYL